MGDPTCTLRCSEKSRMSTWEPVCGAWMIVRPAPRYIIT